MIRCSLTTIKLLYCKFRCCLEKHFIFIYSRLLLSKWFYSWCCCFQSTNCVVVVSVSVTHCSVHCLWCFSVRFLTHTIFLSLSLSPSSFSPVLMLCTWFLFCLVKFLTFIESHLCPRSASASSISSPVPTPKVPLRSRSIDRLKSSLSSSDASSPDSTQVC